MFVLSECTNGMGMGSRIFALANTLCLAELLGDINYAKFQWKSESWGKYKKQDESGANIGNMSLDEKENIFTPAFIEQFYLGNIRSQKMQRNNEFESFEAFKREFFNRNSDIFITRFGLVTDTWRDLDYNECRKTLENIFAKIDLLPRYKEIIKKAKDDGAKLGDFIVLHLRSGDVIYNFEIFNTERLKNYQSVGHATPYEFAIELIERNFDKTTLIVGDDEPAMNELQRYFAAQGRQIFTAMDMRKTSEYSNTDLLFYDIALMSMANTIYGTHSAMVRTAMAMNSKCKWPDHTFNVLSKQEQYETLQKNYGKLNLHRYQRAYSLFNLYKGCAEFEPQNYEKQLGFIKEAQRNDFESNKYSIYILFLLMKLNDRAKANKIAKKIVMGQREREFFMTLFLHYWNGRLAYENVFGEFAREENLAFPFLSYIAARILQTQSEYEKNANNNAEKSLEFLNSAAKFARNAYEKCGDLDFAREFYFAMLTKQNEGLAAQSAALRAQNDELSRQCGELKTQNEALLNEALNSQKIAASADENAILNGLQTELENSQNELKKVRGDFKAALNERDKAFAERDEALRCKEHLSYKLGNALIKAYKTRWHSGLAKFVFRDIWKIHAEFKAKKGE